MVARREQELKPVLPNMESPDDYLDLLSLVYKQGQYWLYHAKSPEDDEYQSHVDRVWRIVRYESFNPGKINSSKVVQGDIIKFGRVRFQIKKLVIDRTDIDASAIDDGSETLVNAGKSN